MLRRPLIAVLASTPAWASGLDAPTPGTPFSGPTTADAAAVHHNPAALAGLHRIELLAGAGFAAGRVRFERARLGSYPFADGLVFDDPVDPVDLDPARSGTAQPVVATPAAPLGEIFVAGPVWRDRLVVGGGISVPYAAPLRFPDDGAQRFALTQASILIGQVTASLAGRPHHRIWLGVGAGLQVGLASLAKTQDFAALDLLAGTFADPPIGQPNGFGPDAPSTLREQDVLARPFVLRNALGIAGTFQVGLVAVPHDRVHLGVAWQHASRMVFRGAATLDLDDPLFTSDLAAKGLQYPARVRGTARLSLTLPDRLSAAASVEISDTLGVDLTGAWVRWSRVQDLRLDITSDDLVQPELDLGDTASANVPRRWVDSGHGAARVRVRVHRDTWLALGASYQSPASPDATVDVASVDMHRLGGQAGVRASLGQRLVLFGGVDVQGGLRRTVDTSDFDLANGSYDLFLATGRLHLAARLGPLPDPRGAP